MDTSVESISPNNLYANGYIVEFPQDGEAILLRDKVVIEPDINDTYHTYLEGQRLRLIAYDKYKDYDSKAAELWWVIADANNILNPLDMPEWVGKDLLIPDYKKVKLLVS